MNDAELCRIYQDALAARTLPQRCPDPVRLRDLVTGSLGEPERPALLDYVMACPMCRRDYDLLRSLHEARPRTSQTPVRLLALAASVVAVIGAAVFLTLRHPDLDVTRGADTAVRLVAPAGSAAGSGLEFSWDALAGEPRYTLEVIDPGGTVVFSITTRESAVALPDSVRLDPAFEYRWRVRAVRADGSERRSDFQTFRVR